MQLFHLHTIRLKMQIFQSLAVVRLLCLCSGPQGCRANPVRRVVLLHQPSVLSVKLACVWCHGNHSGQPEQGQSVSVCLTLLSPGSQYRGAAALLQAHPRAPCLVEQEGRGCAHLRSGLCQVFRQEPEPKGQPAKLKSCLDNQIPSTVHLIILMWIVLFQCNIRDYELTSPPCYSLLPTTVFTAHQKYVHAELLLALHLPFRTQSYVVFLSFVSLLALDFKLNHSYLMALLCVSMLVVSSRSA